MLSSGFESRAALWARVPHYFEHNRIAYNFVKNLANPSLFSFISTIQLPSEATTSTYVYQILFLAN